MTLQKEKKSIIIIFIKTRKKIYNKINFGIEKNIYIWGKIS